MVLTSHIEHDLYAEGNASWVVSWAKISNKDQNLCTQTKDNTLPELGWKGKTCLKLVNINWSQLESHL